MNWKEDLKKFNLPHAKILYMIYYFYKSGKLNFEQKFKLKEYVIMESEKIFEILYNFEQDKNELILLEELKKIYAEEIKCSFEAPDDNKKIKEKKKFNNNNNNNNINPPSTLLINGETINSPIGSSLQKKKMNNQNKKNANNSKKNNAEKEVIIDNMGVCDVGMSPMILRNKFQKNHFEKKEQTPLEAAYYTIIKDSDMK